MRFLTILSLLSLILASSAYGPCTLSFGQSCMRNSECCYSLHCSQLTRRCECPFGYDWSSSFNKCYRCPSGWVFFDDKCYFISTNKLNWLQANDECKKINGTLASFNSDVIVDKLNQFFKLNALNEPFLIGARTTFVPGNWTWQDGTFIPAAGPWWSGCFEPSNSGGNNKIIGEGCAETDSAGLSISDITCDNAVTRRFVCEYYIPKRTANPSTNKNSRNNNNNNNIPPKPVSRCIPNFKWSDKLRKCVECPDRWTLIDDRCYMVSDISRTWTAANDYCKTMKSTLAVIDTAVVVDVLAPLFRLNNLPSDSLWVGASLKNNVWTWLNDKTLATPGLWWSNCRNIGPGNGECVGAFGFGLENLPCTTERRFICRLDNSRIY